MKLSKIVKLGSILFSIVLCVLISSCGRSKVNMDSYNINVEKDKELNIIYEDSVQSLYNDYGYYYDYIYGVDNIKKENKRTKDLSYEDAKTKAIEIIKKYEGFSPKGYKCPSGKITLGHGLTGHHIKNKHTITKKESERIVSKIYDDLFKELSNDFGSQNVVLDNQEMGALISFIFNIGITKFKTTTLYNNITVGHKTPKELLRFKYAKDKKGSYVVLNGLEKRRLDEYKLFIN